MSESERREVEKQVLIEGIVPEVLWGAVKGLVGERLEAVRVESVVAEL